MTRLRLGVVCFAIAALTGCARTKPSLPTGSGTPYPGFAAAYEQAVQDCRGAKSVVAELRLSGRAGNTKLRGTIHAGLAGSSDIRLEGVALGRAIFILVGTGGTATLLLPRDDRVVRGAAPESIVEALAGVALTPADLRAIIAGCGLGVATAVANGRSFGDEWTAVDAGATVTYLRRIEGRWRVAAAVRDPVTVFYEQFASGLPATIQVRSVAPSSDKNRPAADITLRVSQLEINTAIDPKAFELRIPADAEPLSLDGLRRAGPLGERR